MSDHPTDASRVALNHNTPMSAPVSDIAVTDATPIQRLLAALLDIGIIVALTFVLSVLALEGYVSLTGDDFDGPLSFIATGEWFDLSMLGFFALLLSTFEIWFGRSIGKTVVGIRIEGRNRFVRWFVKWLPLFAFALIAWIGYGYMQTTRADYDMQFTQRFHERMLWMVALLPSLIAIALTSIAMLQHRLFHDRLAGTIVVRPCRASDLRAFTPIMHQECSNV